MAHTAPIFLSIYSSLYKLSERTINVGYPLLTVQRPNVLLIVLDTARFDIVSGSNLMPALETLQMDGCQFTSCFANAPWTLPSHSSLFTGQRPSDHGITNGNKVFDVKSDLASLLGDAGYDTAAFSNNPWISPDFGFDSFDDFVACWKRFQRGSDLAGISQLEGKKAQLKAFGRNLLDWEAPFTLANALYMRFLRDRYDSGAKLTNRFVTEWLDERGENPFFAFINYMEPHLEYDPPEEYAKRHLPDGVSIDEARKVNQDPWAYLVGEEEMGEREFEILRSLYRAELAYLDKRLKELYDYLDRTDQLDETVVIVVGDHGENIGDHGLIDHQYCLYDTLLHVPLIIRYPKVFDDHIQFDGLVELRDVFPTILEFAGIKPPTDETTADTSIIEYISNDTGRENVISEYPSPQPAIETLRERYNRVETDFEQFDRSLRSIRTTKWKYIESSDKNDELYNLSTDSGEKQNIVGSEPELERELRTKLEDELGEMSNSTAEGGDRKIPEANKQHLEDLGYL